MYLGPKHGSDVNILPKNTLESLGKPQLVYSPIQ